MWGFSFSPLLLFAGNDKKQTAKSEGPRSLVLGWFLFVNKRNPRGKTFHFTTENHRHNACEGTVRWILLNAGHLPPFGVHPPHSLVRSCARKVSCPLSWCPRAPGVQDEGREPWRQPPGLGIGIESQYFYPQAASELTPWMGASLHLCFVCE